MSSEQITELSQRIEDLESRVAFQEQAIESLSGALYDHQQENRDLALKMGWLLDKVNELSQQWPASTAGEEPPPPHY